MAMVNKSKKNSSKADDWQEDEHIRVDTEHLKYISAFKDKDGEWPWFRMVMRRMPFVSDIYSDSHGNKKFDWQPNVMEYIEKYLEPDMQKELIAKILDFTIDNSISIPGFKVRKTKSNKTSKQKPRKNSMKKGKAMKKAKNKAKNKKDMKAMTAESTKAKIMKPIKKKAMERKGK
jgi:hypothetical protein